MLSEISFSALKDFVRNCFDVENSLKVVYLIKVVYQSGKFRIQEKGRTFLTLRKVEKKLGFESS